MGTHPYVTLMSLPHTGTRFMVKYLTESKGVDYVRQGAGIKAPTYFRHIGGTVMIWGHYSHLHMQNVGEFYWDNPTVIPMRDPLLVAISHIARGKPFNQQVITEWRHAVDDFPKFDPMYVPVDLTTTSEERYAILVGVNEHIGWVDDRQARWWSIHWDEQQAPFTERSPRKPNVQELYQAYLCGNMDLLEENMPQPVHGLREQESHFRPWLEGIGYENLMWWHDHEPKPQYMVNKGFEEDEPTGWTPDHTDPILSD